MAGSSTVQVQTITPRRCRAAINSGESIVQDRSTRSVANRRALSAIQLACSVSCFGGLHYRNHYSFTGPHGVSNKRNQASPAHAGITRIKRTGMHEVTLYWDPALTWDDSSATYDVYLSETRWHARRDWPRECKCGTTAECKLEIGGLESGRTYYAGVMARGKDGTNVHPESWPVEFTFTRDYRP